MTQVRNRFKRIAAAVPVLLVMSAAPAAAHVEFTPTSISSGASTLVTSTFSHDCSGKGTTSLEMKVPEGVTMFRPVVAAGWTITQEGAKGSGGMSDVEKPSAASSVTWTHDGGPVPTDNAGALSAVVAASEDAEMLWFPVVQTCPGGEELSWVQTAESAEAAHDLDTPAPGLKVVARDGEHGHSMTESHSEEGADAEKASATQDTAEETAEEAEDTAVTARNIAIGSIVLTLLFGIGFAVMSRAREHKNQINR